MVGWPIILAPGLACRREKDLRVLHSALVRSICLAVSGGRNLADRQAPCTLCAPSYTRPSRATPRAASVKQRRLAPVLLACRPRGKALPARPGRRGRPQPQHRRLQQGVHRGQHNSVTRWARPWHKRKRRRQTKDRRRRRRSRHREIKSGRGCRPTGPS
jgi:hypothetical protein